MGKSVLLLLIGFLLTSVAGGALGYLFQRRTWEHQHRAQMNDQQRDHARNAYEEISTLLDKRLYRMRLLYWAAKRQAQGHDNMAELRSTLGAYREALLTWNDNLNRTLALTETYFGGDVRQRLETIQDVYRSIGQRLDLFVLEVSTESAAGIEIPNVGRRLTSLSQRIYALNLAMLALLQQDRLGQLAPKAHPSSPSRQPVVEFGAQGPAVRRLQRALIRAGATGVGIDGQFGKATEAAVRAFQQSRTLDADGVVGPQTWTELPAGDPMPKLSVGSQGEVVAKLQTVLNGHGLAPGLTAAGDEHGSYGSQTAAAVKTFQKTLGLPQDGVVGDRTWASPLEVGGTTLEGAVGLGFVIEPSRSDQGSTGAD